MCGTSRCSSGLVVAGNQGRKCSEGKKKKSKSEGAACGFSTLLGWGRASEELLACAATTYTTLKRIISRALALSSPSGKSQPCKVV